MQGRLHARTLIRRAAGYGDDALGEWLALELRRALARGGAPPVAACVRADRVDVFDLRASKDLGLSTGQFLALLSASTLDGDPAPPEAVGVLGRASVRRSTGEAASVIVFLEWADCRWWLWDAPVDGARLTAEGTVRRAVDRQSRPGGLGGWWTSARRHGLTARLERIHPAEPEQTVVH